MELNVWTSSTVSHIQRDPSTGIYKVTVSFKGQKEGTRVLTVKHVIFATGLSGGAAYMPTYPGMVTILPSLYDVLMLKMISGKIQRADSAFNPT